ncbi:hypothetical protein Apa02nite_030470 [Actinoplanes palleronii]|uniref:Uncharacterized protein n=1 Tax=Actinoplanes palleronii TaxID=113570 RepID=A0ABQ4B8D0_9ACTN|nr:hypothetical protein Apa02nite_030470 [Actinoplanes palleronii]
MLLAVLSVAAFYVLIGDHLRDDVLTLARDLSGGTDRGMAVAAWVFLSVPVWLFVTITLVFRRSRWLGVVPAGIVAALLLVPMQPFWPTRRQAVEDLVHGPGAAGFADGLRWSGATLILLPALVAALELFDGAVYRRGKPADGPARRGHLVWIVVAGGATLSLGALVIGVAVAG